MSPWRVRITNGATYRPWVRLYMAQYAPYLILEKPNANPCVNQVTASFPRPIDPLHYLGSIVTTTSRPFILYFNFKSCLFWLYQTEIFHSPEKTNLLAGMVRSPIETASLLSLSLALEANERSCFVYLADKEKMRLLNSLEAGRGSLGDRRRFFLRSPLPLTFHVP